PGVQEASVNFAAERASVRFDPAAVDTDRLVRRVGELGYEVPLTRLTLPVSGMSCAACVGRVEQALRELPGVVEASVNLASERAQVAFPTDWGTVADLRSAVQAVGYDLGPAPTDAAEPDREQAARAGEIARLWRRVLVGAALSVPVLLGSFPGLFPWVPVG